MNTIRLRTILVDRGAARSALPDDRQLDPGARLDAPPHLTAVVEDVRKRPGISVSEVCLNLAISFGSGIPAGVVATWIWERVSGKGANPILPPDDGEEAVSLAEIAELVRRLVREQAPVEQEPAEQEPAEKESASEDRDASL